MTDKITNGMQVGSGENWVRFTNYYWILFFDLQYAFGSTGLLKLHKGGRRVTTSLWFSHDRCKVFSRLGNFISSKVPFCTLFLKKWSELIAYVKAWLRFAQSFLKIFAVISDFVGNLFQDGWLGPVALIGVKL